MIKQLEITLHARSRGAHLITHEIEQKLPALPETGILNIFIAHTSAALTINENADPDVRSDISKILDNLIKEHEPYYKHTFEGPDDMPAHAKSTLVGPSLTIPISNHHLRLGTWQGIYLLEFRNNGGPRKIVITIIGE